LVPVRLDRCFVREMEASDAQILARGSSDHHPITIRLGIPAR
jgi:endonuclease/exonuclease/phosphatase family metal-dependent hydrolase